MPGRSWDCLNPGCRARLGSIGREHDGRDVLRISDAVVATASQDGEITTITMSRAAVRIRYGTLGAVVTCRCGRKKVWVGGAILIPSSLMGVESAAMSSAV